MPPNPRYVYYHTHWDREWYQPFRAYQYRLCRVVDALLDALDAGQLPCFTLDGQTVLLEDYFELRPQHRARLEAYVRTGKISVGPWYIAPDAFLVSGESLRRNLQLGMAQARALGETRFTGYLPDTFGHSADMPALLREQGITTAIVWRGVGPERPWFTWQSPGGQSVLAYHLSDGYFQHFFHMGTAAERLEYFKSWVKQVDKLSAPGDPQLFSVGADHLGIVPDATQMMAELDAQTQPTTTANFMAQAEQSGLQNLPIKTGELFDTAGPYLLPGVWSARVYLKQANRRTEWRFERHLEPLLKIAEAQLGFAWPQAELDLLWKTLLLNQPHDSICGCSVDAVHRENEVRFDQIEQLSQAMLDDVHARFVAQSGDVDAVLAINLLETPYTGVLHVLRDTAQPHDSLPQWPGQQVLAQETVLEATYTHNPNVLPLADNLATQLEAAIWVKNLLPRSVGLVQPAICPLPALEAGQNRLANAEIAVSWNAIGQLTLSDLHNGTVWHQTLRLLRQPDQGDSYNAAPKPGTMPEFAIFIRAEWKHQGPLWAEARLHYRWINIDLPVILILQLQAGSPLLTCTVEVTNNTLDQRLWVDFVCHEPVTQVLAEGHLTPILRHYDPAYSLRKAMPATKLKELRVNGGPIQRWIQVNGQTVITEGLCEYWVDGTALQLTLLRAFGYLSKPDTGTRGGNAGPPLPTPEGQCLHRELKLRFAWLPETPEAIQPHVDAFYGGVYGL